MIQDDKINIKNIQVTNSKTESWEIPIAISVIIIAIIASYWMHYLAAALNLLGLWIFVKHYLGSTTFLARFFKQEKVNVNFYQSPKTTESKKNLLLLLPSRFYSNTISAGFFTFFKYTQFAYIFISGLSILWLYSKDIVSNQKMYYGGNAILLLVQLSFFIFYLIFQKNLTRHEENIDIFPITEALEKIDNLHILQQPKSGILSSMRHFIDDNDYSLNPQNTLVVNIAKLTNSKFSILNGEGVIVFHQYENQILSQALNMGYSAKENKIYPSALLPFINAGFSGFSIEFSGNLQDNLQQLDGILKY